MLDSEGNLLLVDVGTGVVGYKIADRSDGSSCLIEKKVIVANEMVCLPYFSVFLRRGVLKRPLIYI